jgi:DNA-binding PadR family transcriptional regulator
MPISSLKRFERELEKRKQTGILLYEVLKDLQKHGGRRKVSDYSRRTVSLLVKAGYARIEGQGKDKVVVITDAGRARLGLSSMRLEKQRSPKEMRYV